jgi:hypothetical protein
MLHGSTCQTFERVPRSIRITGLIAFRYGLIGSPLLPPVLQRLLSTRLAKHLHGPVTVEQVRINLLPLSVSVRGLKVNEAHSSVKSEE